MAKEIKKMRYFDGLFLKQEEFNLEQNYHTEMRYRHNRYLHTRGIADGLDVEFLGPHSVKVTKGMALNEIPVEGEILSQEIVLTEDTVVDLAGFAPGDVVYLYITRTQVKADIVEDKGGTEEIHWWERAVITASKTEPDEKNFINFILAKVIIKADGTIDKNSIITEEGGASLRVSAGVRGKVLEMEKLTFAITGVTSYLPSIEGKSIGGQNCVQVNAPAANFTGDLTVSGTVNGRDVSVDGTNLSNHLKNKSNPHETNAAQVGALPIDGGNLTGSLTITQNLTVNGTASFGNLSAQSLTVSGTVNGRNVSVDGTNLDNHLANKSNPHETNAAQVGALPATGGSLTGSLSVTQNLSVSGSGSFGSDLSVTGNLTVTGTINPAGAVMQMNGPLSIRATNKSYGLKLHTEPPTGMAGWGLMSMITEPGSGGGYLPAAIVAYSKLSGYRGVYAEAPLDTYAIHANGNCVFFGNSYFNGDIEVAGDKSGYVVDAFVNRSGQRLHTGDIVKLKGTPISFFKGKDNKIPVAEVTLADQENDSRVIGVVNCEAHPGLDSPDTRIGADDPTFIEDGGILTVVTLGAYSHCKVDATEAPIEVGDLLTTSAKPGYAKKATNPKIGSIIGKALEPLESGTGYIAVFINIQ